MILAAGCGQRLRPLTHLQPKPLFPICHQPLVGWTLRYLARHRIREVVINLHHLAPAMQRGLAQFPDWGVTVQGSYEPELLGTAGGLKKAEAFLQEEPFVLINSDILIDLDLDAVIAFHRASRSFATLVLREDAEAARYGTIGVSTAGRIGRFLRWTTPENLDPLRETMFTGVHVLEPHVLEMIPAGRYSSISEELYPELIRQGHPVAGYVTKGYWIDVGTPGRYLQAHWDVLAGEAPLQVELPQELPGVWSGKGLNLGSGVELRPPVVLGDGCRVGNGCVIGPRVVTGHRCELGERVRLQDSVLWDDIRIGAHSTVERSIVGAGVTLPANTELQKKMAAWIEDTLRIGEAE